MTRSFRPCRARRARISSPAAPSSSASPQAKGLRELMQAVTRGAKALAASLERAGLPLYLGGTDPRVVILDLQ